MVTDCPFCGIGAGKAPIVVIYASAELVALLNRSPVRRGHTQIIPTQHFDYFDDLPTALATEIVSVGQRIAQRLKEVYGVNQVGFLFTGGDVAHVHAHVIPFTKGQNSLRRGTSSIPMALIGRRSICEQLRRIF